MNARGQALIESLLSLPIVLSGALLLLLTMYMLLSQHLLEHWVYETSVCLAQEYPSYSCETELRKKIALFSFHRLNSVTILNSAHMVETKIEITNPTGRKSYFQARLTLPLVDL